MSYERRKNQEVYEFGKKSTSRERVNKTYERLNNKLDEVIQEERYREETGGYQKRKEKDDGSIFDRTMDKTDVERDNNNDRSFNNKTTDPDSIYYNEDRVTKEQKKRKTNEIVDNNDIYSFGKIKTDFKEKDKGPLYDKPERKSEGEGLYYQYPIDLSLPFDEIQKQNARKEQERQQDNLNEINNRTDRNSTAAETKPFYEYPIDESLPSIGISKKSEPERKSLQQNKGDEVSEISKEENQGKKNKTFYEYPSIIEESNIDESYNKTEKSHDSVNKVQSNKVSLTPFDKDFVRNAHKTSPHIYNKDKEVNKEDNKEDSQLDNRDKDKPYYEYPLTESDLDSKVAQNSFAKKKESIRDSENSQQKRLYPYPTGGNHDKQTEVKREEIVDDSKNKMVEEQPYYNYPLTDSDIKESTTNDRNKNINDSNRKKAKDKEALNQRDKSKTDKQPFYQYPINESDLNEEGKHNRDKSRTDYQPFYQHPTNENNLNEKEKPVRDKSRTDYQPFYQHPLNENNINVEGKQNRDKSRTDVQPFYQYPIGESDLNKEGEHNRDKSRTDVQPFYKHPINESDLNKEGKQVRDKSRTDVQPFYQYPINESDLDKEGKQVRDKSRTDYQPFYQHPMNQNNINVEGKQNRDKSRTDVQPFYQYPIGESNYDEGGQQNRDKSRTDVQPFYQHPIPGDHGKRENRDKSRTDVQPFYQHPEYNPNKDNLDRKQSNKLQDSYQNRDYGLDNVEYNDYTKDSIKDLANKRNNRNSYFDNNEQNNNSIRKESQRNKEEQYNIKPSDNNNINNNKDEKDYFNYPSIVDSFKKVRNENAEDKYIEEKNKFSNESKNSSERDQTSYKEFYDPYSLYNKDKGTNNLPHKASSLRDNFSQEANHLPKRFKTTLDQTSSPHPIENELYKKTNKTSNPDIAFYKEKRTSGRFFKLKKNGNQPEELINTKYMSSINNSGFIEKPKLEPIVLYRIKEYGKDVIYLQDEEGGLKELQRNDNPDSYNTDSNREIDVDYVEQEFDLNKNTKEKLTYELFLRNHDKNATAYFRKQRSNIPVDFKQKFRERFGGNEAFTKKGINEEDRNKLAIGEIFKEAGFVNEEEINKIRKIIGDIIDDDSVNNQYVKRKSRIQSEIAEFMKKNNLNSFDDLKKKNVQEIEQFIKRKSLMAEGFSKPQKREDSINFRKKTTENKNEQFRLDLKTKLEEFMARKNLSAVEEMKERDIIEMENFIQNECFSEAEQFKKRYVRKEIEAFMYKPNAKQEEFHNKEIKREMIRYMQSHNINSAEELRKKSIREIEDFIRKNNKDTGEKFKKHYIKGEINEFIKNKKKIEEERLRERELKGVIEEYKKKKRISAFQMLKPNEVEELSEFIKKTKTDIGTDYKEEKLKEDIGRVLNNESRIEDKDIKEGVEDFMIENNIYYFDDLKEKALKEVIDFIKKKNPEIGENHRKTFISRQVTKVNEKEENPFEDIKDRNLKKEIKDFIEGDGEGVEELLDKDKQNRESFYIPDTFNNEELKQLNDAFKNTNSKKENVINAFSKKIEEKEKEFNEEERNSFNDNFNKNKAKVKSHSYQNVPVRSEKEFIKSRRTFMAEMKEQKSHKEKQRSFEEQEISLNNLPNKESTYNNNNSNNGKKSKGVIPSKNLTESGIIRKTKESFKNPEDFFTTVDLADITGNSFRKAKYADILEIVDQFIEQNKIKRAVEEIIVDREQGEIIMKLGISTVENLTFTGKQQLKKSKVVRRFKVMSLTHMQQEHIDFFLKESRLKRQ